MKKIVFLLALVFAIPALSWTPNGQSVSIVKIWHWHDDNTSVSHVVFETSAGHFCYIPPDEESMYSLILTLFTTGKNASIHCYDSEESIHGKLAHRVHKVIAVQ